MRGVTIDKEAKTITAQGGCTWEDVDKASYEHGLVTVGGTVNHTGIGGLTLGGGYGWLSGEYGLVIDNLLSVQMVLADGSIVTASNSENKDLFWAVRGAGQSFGVVVEFTYRAYEQTSSVWAGQIAFIPNDLETLAATVNDLHAKAKGNSGMVLGFVRPPPAFLPVATAFLYFNGPATEAEDFYAPLFALKPVMNSCASMAYPELNSMINFAVGHGDRKTSKGATFTTPIRPAFFQSIFDEYANFIKQNPSIFCTLLFEQLPSEKICAISNDAMAFANRGDHQNALISPKWKDPARDEKCRAWAAELAGKFEEEKERRKWEGIRMKHEGSGQYGNYDGDFYSLIWVCVRIVDKKNLGLNERGQIIFAANYPRLQELKRKFDANNIFNKSHVQIDTSVNQVESGIGQLAV